MNAARSRELALPRPKATAAATTGDKEIDGLVERIRALYNGAALDFHIQTGRLIVETIYAGRLEQWNDLGDKHPSYRKLAGRPDLPVSASTLYRAVELYRLWSRIEAPKALRHVGAAHMQEVLGLPVERQLKLLESAESGRWTVRQLRAATQEIRRETKGKRGRPALPVTLRQAHQIRTAFERLTSAFVDEAMRLDPRHCMEIAGIAKDLHARCAALAATAAHAGLSRGSRR